jgi:galactokinase
MEHLEKIKMEISPTDYKRAKYILEENERVQKMITALKAGDAQEVGNILLQGHWAMSREFEITTPELDFLVKTGEKQDGVVGSRMMGGGFGGCTINLLKTDQVESCLDKIKRAYYKETQISCETYPLKIGDGVHIIQ